MIHMRHVLIASDFGKPWNPGFYIKKGLERNGVGVTVFDLDASRDLHGGLINAVQEAMPDCLLYIKNYGLRPEWLAEVKRMGVPLVQWYIDPVIPEWLPAFVKEADIFFTMSEGLVDTFRQMNPTVFWLTQAFEPSFFQVKSISDHDRRTFSADVTFVGNLGSKPQYLSRRSALERIISAGVGLRWWGPKIPWKISNTPLIYGRLGRTYGGRFVWGEEYAKVAKLSKIFLAFDSMPHIRKSMSARMYTAVGCGAFYLCRHVEGIEDVLVPDKEIVTFRDEDEMIDKIQYYLGKEDLRRKIANAGQKRVLEDHTYEVRIKEMLTIIENNI